MRIRIRLAELFLSVTAYIFPIFFLALLSQRMTNDGEKWNG